MSIRDFSGANFYKYATDLFVETGHMVASSPEFINHSAEEFVFLDASKDAVFSSAQRRRLKQFGNVSKLFTVDFGTGVEGINERITFFSIEIYTEDNDRSQAAFDIHALLHPLTGADGTVCAFLYEENILISVMGFGLNCVLSDWFSVYDDTDELHGRLNIGEVSLDSAMAYIASLAYNVGRNYYIYPPDSVFALHKLLPADMFTGYDADLIMREELSTIVQERLYADIHEYGDDYVEYSQKVSKRGIDIADELALMMLDFDEESDNPFGEELELEDDLDYDEFSDEERDDYEFEDVDPEIFKDPTLMVQWLENGGEIKKVKSVEAEEPIQEVTDYDAPRQVAEEEIVLPGTEFHEPDLVSLIEEIAPITPEEETDSPVAGEDAKLEAEVGANWAGVNNLQKRYSGKINRVIMET